MKNLGLKVTILCLIGILGCSSEKAAVKPPSAEALRVKEALEILSKLNKAYDDKDAISFMQYISPTTSPLSLRLEEGIKKDFSIYDKISLNQTIRWAKIKEDTIQLAVHWEGRWLDRRGKEIRERGNAVFSFKDEEGLRLIGIDGDNPFGISGQ